MLARPSTVGVSRAKKEAGRTQTALARALIALEESVRLVMAGTYDHDSGRQGEANVDRGRPRVVHELVQAPLLVRIRPGQAAGALARLRARPVHARRARRIRRRA